MQPGNAATAVRATSHWPDACRIPAAAVRMRGMLPNLAADYNALTDSITRAISLGRQMFACEERLDQLELEFSSNPNATYAEKLRQTRLEVERIGRTLLAAYDEINSIDRRRESGR